jgi:hypothetical protein
MNASAELRRLASQRDVLRAAFDSAWGRLPKRNDAALEDWAGAALELMRVNAGPACQIAFWSASASGLASLPELAASGRSAAQICRDAGARAALQCLEALPAALSATRDGPGIEAWRRGLERLAREAPESVGPAADRAQTLLADAAGTVFSDFVAAGLKAHLHDAAARLAFFSLQDPFARVLLLRRPDAPDFSRLSRFLSAYATALWGDAAILQAAPASDDPEPRATLAGRVALLPAATRAKTAAEAGALYVATAAHACAHLALPPVRHAVGPLKPLQVVLVGLIEDARVEALAMRAFPGLRRAWAPFHAAPASGPRTASNLLERLSRALFDPAHADPDGFVAKGRAMFADAADDLADPELSLRVGRALGHDLGQMRVQFNWREHVVQPAYRDDGNHLWEPDEERRAAPVELAVEAAEGGGAAGGAGRAREAPADERGSVIAIYPEWDSSAGVERPHWTTLRDVPARAADATRLRAAIKAEQGPRRRIAGLVRGSVIGRPARLRRQSDGDDLDIDAALDAVVALRSGHAPDPRLFRLTRPCSRDLSTVIMLDSSASTAAPLPDGRSVLDVQVLAVALLAEALDARGDPFALRAFASDGRDDVRLTRIKDRSEPFDDAVMRRLAGLRPELSTRLGAALRHAGAEFGARAWRRLLLVLTDGEPSDVDVRNRDDLIVDARRAALGLRNAGVDVFGIVLDPAGVGSAQAIFGRRNTLAVRDLADLPARLAGLYFRLARR